MNYLSFTGSSSDLYAQISGVGQISDAPVFGGFNTTAGGSIWWDVNGAFSITFLQDTKILAFGFYGTDIGDNNGHMTLWLR